MKHKTKLKFLLGLILILLVLAIVSLYGIINIDLWVVRDVFVVPSVIMTAIVLYENIKK